MEKTSISVQKTDEDYCPCQNCGTNRRKQNIFGKEINEIIRSNIAFGDIELVRREMYQYHFLGRLRDGSEYWAEADWKDAYAEYLSAD